MKPKSTLITGMILFLSVGFWPLKSLANNPAEKERISLLSAIERISQEYNVYFTFDMTLVSEVKVEYEHKEYKTAEGAVSAILRGTDLKYKFYDQRFVILYKKGEEGLESLKKMSEHLDGLIGEEEQIVRSTVSRRSGSVLSPLPNHTFSKIIKAMNFSVEGTVTDEEGEPLIGVNIQVKGSNKGTSTDFDGKFIINDVDKDAILVVSYVGYQIQEISIAGKTDLVIVMISDSQLLDEVVVVGYGTQKKVDLTGAIDVINTDVLENSSASNPLIAIQGQVPGAYVTTNGSPGAGASIIIRGLSTLGDNSPLYIIDGFPTKNGIDNLDPSSIENIQILKDAAAASIYGSRASNGVIIVETKSGSDSKLTFDSRITTQKYRNVIDVLNTQQRGEAMWRALINEGNEPRHALYDFEWNKDFENPVLSKVTPVTWINQDLGIKAADTDWWDEVTKTGIIIQNSLTLSTGGKNGGSRLSVTHHNNNGVFINDTYSKINVNLNSFYRFKDIVEIGESFTVSSSTRYPDHVRGGATNTQSIIPVYTENSDWGGPWGAGFEDWLQPVADSYINSWDNTQRKRLMGSGYVSINLIHNLVFRTTVGMEYLNSLVTDYQRPYQSGFLSRDVANLTKNSATDLNWNLSNTLSYYLDLDRSQFNFLVGNEFYKNTSEFLNAFADDFAFDDRDYYQMNTAVGTQTVSGNVTGYQLLSYFGKVNYNFDDKYLIATTLRYDGSSRFGTENRFGLFPSISAGWRLEQEDFFKDNLDVFDLLKLRYGYGVVGNQEIGNDASLALFEALYGMDYTWDWDESTSYDIDGKDGGNLPSGFRRVKAGNPNLKWETTTENNIGVDFEILNSVFGGSFDYYVRKSKDILIQPPYLGAIGEGGHKWYNGASVENKGWELILNYRKFFQDFGFNVSTNFGHFKDKITYLPDDVVNAYPGNVEKTILGQSQRALFGYIADGLFQNQAEVESHADQTGKDIGRIRYKDLNGDGVINALDQDYQGTTLPKLIYGLRLNSSYKKFNLDLFFNGEAGKNIYNSIKTVTDFVFERAGINYGTRVLDAWTPQNTSSAIPALITSNKNNEFRSSSYFIENGSYFKLRYFDLSYDFDFPGSRVFSKIKVYLLGENIGMIKSKKFSGVDPENPGTDYGRPLSLSLGVKLDI